MSFTMKYAAPETIWAFRRGDKTIAADPAADVWAFGMICFELLTHQQFYGASCNANDVAELLDSDLPLPTEKELPPDVAGKHHTCYVFFHRLFVLKQLLFVDVYRFVCSSDHTNVNIKNFQLAISTQRCRELQTCIG